METLTDAPASIGIGASWGFSHLEQITLALEDEQEKWEAWTYYGYSRRSHKLGEMGLCHAWTDRIQKDIGIPDGYTIREEGKVTSTDIATGTIIRKNAFHKYLESIDSNGRRRIICLTAAHMLLSDELPPMLDDPPEDKGKAMERMRQRADKAQRPDMYVALSDEIAILEGYADEIETIFGLQYH